MAVKDVKKKAGNYYSQAIQYGVSEEEFMRFFNEVMTIFVDAKKEHYKEQQEEVSSWQNKNDNDKLRKWNQS